ncbi:hypothetical protein LZK80_36635 (plasmid) [Rhizobium leguminosarum]|nr:hypothetical protein LZK80_36635 [Rhizobium leguminosarum]
MMAPYPFNIDVSTLEGQLEVLRLWSNAELNISSALLILKVTTAELLQLAQRHGIAPPSEDALDKRIKDLEARVRPQLRKSKRDQAEKELSGIRTAVAEALDRVASIALEARTYGQVEAQQSYSFAHARLRRALDSVASVQEKFDEARLLENEAAADFEYTDASVKVLRNLERVVPRPDYYLVGDFNHAHPVTEHDILWSWSQGFLATSTARKCLFWRRAIQSMRSHFSSAFHCQGRRQSFLPRQLPSLVMSRWTVIRPTMFDGVSVMVG